MGHTKNDYPILIIDKDFNRRNSLSSRLRHIGFKTELISSGFQAIHTIEKALDNEVTYGLILIVENTEDMPALEIISLSRNIIDKKSVPILVMKKESEPEEIIEFMSAGANDFLMATDNFKQLLSKIEKIFPKTEK